MSPRRSGPPIDPPKPGPEAVLRLDLYVRLLLNRSELGWVDVARFIGAQDKVRRKVSRAFEGGRRIPDWTFVEAVVRCCVGGNEAEVHLSRCRALHKAAQSGQRGPVVQPDEVTVELASGDHEIDSGDLLSTLPEESARAVREHWHRTPDLPTGSLPTGRPRVEIGGRALVILPVRRTRRLEPLFDDEYGVTGGGNPGLGASRRRSRQRAAIAVLLGVFIAGYESHNIGLNGIVSPAVRSCNRGTVAARDLWLRDEFGATLSEITRGQLVTIDSRPNPNGMAYRLVTADDGRTGWVDARWIKPYCV